MLGFSAFSHRVQAYGEAHYLVGGFWLLSAQLPQQRSSLAHLVIRIVTWYGARRVQQLFS